MARAVTYAALVATALLLQLTVLAMLPFPGRIAPDLVLLVVVAIALANGVLPGLVTGFAAGLALDLAPPASHAIGGYALVFCLVGYLCGRAAGEIDRSAFLPLAAMALGAVCGSVVYTVVGVTFGEPGVTWAAARNVLPLSVAYDVLLSPFVLYVVLRLTRWAGQPADDPAAALARAGAAVTGRAARGGAAAKNQPREPRLRLGTGRPSGRIGSGVPVGTLAASGRGGGGWHADAGTVAGLGQRQSTLPRLRFSPSKPQAMTAGTRSARPPRLRFGPSNHLGGPAGAQPARPAPPRLRFGPSTIAGTTASGKQNRFSGGSVVRAPVRLRLGANRASRLRSRAGRALGMRPDGHQLARPKFTATRSGGAQLGAGQFGTGRLGTRRTWFARLWRALRFGRRRFDGARHSGPGYAGAQSRMSRPNAPRAGWIRAPRGRTGLRRAGRLSVRARGGWSATSRIGARRTGGRRTGGFR